MKTSSLILLIVLPIFFFLVVAGWLFIKIKTKMADSIWEIQVKDLQFDSPPEVLGRGTFGLVVAATYNTTRVAVKRVIPSKQNPKKRAKFLDELFEIQEGDDLSVFSGAGRSAISGISAAETANSLNSSFKMSRHHKSSGYATNSYMNSSKTTVQLLCPCLYPEHVIMRENFIEEMRYLSKMRHPCITTVMGAVVAKDSEPMLVMLCFFFFYKFTPCIKGVAKNKRLWAVR
jgi:guanylate cyclase